jgi:hypothetical protein
MKLPPIVSTCLLALGIDCCSNVIAQKLRAWKTNIPFVFDYTLFFQFAILVALTVPVNFHWQNWLERTFPGWKVVKRKRDTSSLDDEENAIFLGEDKKMDDEEEVKVRNWWNIFRKWFTDCITMGALLNTTMFLVLMGIMKGKTTALILTDLRNVRSLTPNLNCDLWLTITPGDVADNLQLLQNLAHRQLLQHNLHTCQPSNSLPLLLRTDLEHLPHSRRCTPISLYPSPNPA